MMSDDNECPFEVGQWVTDDWNVGCVVRLDGEMCVEVTEYHVPADGYTWSVATEEDFQEHGGGRTPPLESDLKERAEAAEARIAELEARVAELERERDYWKHKSRSSGTPMCPSGDPDSYGARLGLEADDE
jgi:hypothetical protein